MQFVNRVAESRARRATFARMLARGTLGARRINDTLWVLASNAVLVVWFMTFLIVPAPGE